MTTMQSVLAAALACLLAAPAAQAQDKINLKVGDRYPAGHYIPEYATKFWMDGVTKATGGQVTFQYFGGQQLGKAADMLALTLAGVADVGEIIPSYVAEKLPLSTVSELPGLFGSSCQGGLAAFDLVRPGGFIDRQEYVPNGVRLLFMLVLSPYQVYARQKLDSLAAFKGVKIRSSGPGMDLSIRRIGAVPVRISATELHEALSRGTVDGAIFPAASILQYDLTPFLKSGTVGENFGSVVISYGISERKWKQLPAAVQKAMTDVGVEATRRTCGLLDEDDRKAAEKLREKGTAVAALPPAEKAKLLAELAPVAKEWAADLDRKGRQGSEALRQFTEATKKFK